MRLFITSTPAELELHQAAACEVVSDMGFEPVLRNPALGRGLKPVVACARQVAQADLLLAIVGLRPGRIPPPELGGDGRHPWAWWETRAAFQHGKPVLSLVADDPRLLDPPERTRDNSVMRDFRGELARLAAPFDPADIEGFRDLLRQQLRRQREDRAVLSGLVLRRWPWPPLPERPYPVLLPYTHPDLMAGRERELDEMRRLLARSVAITGLHAASGTGKSSFLAASLVPRLRNAGRAVALDRQPTEPGLAGRLLGQLIESRLPENLASGDDAPHTFADVLAAVRRTSTAQPPVLLLDQFEDLLRYRPAARRARVTVGLLLAATVQRLPGLDEPPCRWLLAYRQEFHSDVVRWLRDVLREARQDEAPPARSLPHDLSTSVRFQSVALTPLGTPAPGTDDPASVAARVFEAAMIQPLALQPASGQRYPWRFAGDGAARLARAFGEARVAHPEAPLVPELQVVLAHLLETAGRPRQDEALIEVPEDPGKLIEQALEQHLRRSLDLAFPHAGREHLGRTRALLALRQLADDRGRRVAGRPAADLAQAIGAAGRDVLDKLATAQTRLVMVEERHGEQFYALSHDRMAEVLVRLFDQGMVAGLGVDVELVGLRRFVGLASELHAAGEVEQATRVPRRDFERIAHNAEALLWDKNQRSWWAACQRRRQSAWRRLALRAILAAAVVALVSLGTWLRTDRRAEYRGWLEQVVTEREPPAALEAVVGLMTVLEGGPVFGDPGFNATDLLIALQQRAQHFTPMDVVEQGLGAFEGDVRSAVVLDVVELALPWVLETPEDPRLIASLVWALDYGPGRDPAFAARATVLRNRVLEPLRQLRPPPKVRDGDPDWPLVPAGSFQMSSRELGVEGDESAGGQVAIRAFRLLRHEVTNAEHRRLDPSYGTRILTKYLSSRLSWYLDRAALEAYYSDGDRPAIGVSWYQAYTYAAWIGGRLPTEAEWEYAARAGCRTEYCDRNGLESSLDAITQRWGHTSPKSSTPSLVMRFEPNPWGIYDMFGNAKEWTADWYAHAPGTAGDRSNPWGPPFAIDQPRLKLSTKGADDHWRLLRDGHARGGGLGPGEVPPFRRLDVPRRSPSSFGGEPPTGVGLGFRVVLPD